MKKLLAPFIDIFRETAVLLMICFIIGWYALPSVLIIRISEIVPESLRVYHGVLYFGSVVYFNIMLFKRLLPYEGKILIHGNASLMVGIRLILIIFVLIFYYGLVYDLFYSINKNYFVCNTTDHVDTAEFVYYSIMTFATVGYGDMYPNATITRLVAGTEVINSIIVLIFLVSSIESFKAKFARFDLEEQKPSWFEKWMAGKANNNTDAPFDDNLMKK